jgi:hypothetical protein
MKTVPPRVKGIAMAAKAGRNPTIFEQKQER